MGFSNSGDLEISDTCIRTVAVDNEGFLVVTNRVIDTDVKNSFNFLSYIIFT